MDYKTSLHEVDFFLGSHLWDDMQRDFDQWLEGVRDELEVSNDMPAMYRCQGRAEAMRFVLKWVENLRDILEEERNASQ